MPEKARNRRFHVGSVMVHVPLSAVVLAWAGRGLATVTTAALRRLRPVLLAALAVGSVCAVLAWSPQTVLSWLAVTAALAAVWRLVHEDSFRGLVIHPSRGWWRRVRVYRPGWEAGMSACGLRTKLDCTSYLPRGVRAVDVGG